MTQQALSAATEIHVQQIKRYEAGSSLPTADAMKKLAISLHVTSDFLLFETDERGPDDRLRYQFEAISRVPIEEQELVRGLLDAVIVKHQVAGAIAHAAGPATKGRDVYSYHLTCVVLNNVPIWAIRSYLPYLSALST